MAGYMWTCRDHRGCLCQLFDFVPAGRCHGRSCTLGLLRGRRSIDGFILPPWRAVTYSPISHVQYAVRKKTQTPIEDRTTIWLHRPGVELVYASLSINQEASCLRQHASNLISTFSCAYINRLYRSLLFIDSSLCCLAVDSPQ